MQTEPIQIELPISKQIVKLRPFATGRVMQAIQKALFGDAEIKTKANQRANAQQEDQEISFKMANINESTNVAIEGMVLAVGDQTTNVLDAVLDLHEDDYNAVKAKVDELTKNSGLDQKKAKS